MRADFSRYEELLLIRPVHSFEEYSRAQDLDKSLRAAASTTPRVVERLELIQRAAAASDAYSKILQSKVGNNTLKY